MKYLSIFSFLFYFSVVVFSQELPSENSRNDSVWAKDVELAVEEFVEFRKYLIQFRVNQSLTLLTRLNPKLVTNIHKLDDVYKSELYRFKIEYSESILGKQDMLYGYTYLDFTLELEKYLFYPNSYAILLNPVRLSVAPKIERGTHEKSRELILEIQRDLEKLDKSLLTELDNLYLKFTEGIPSKYHGFNLGNLSNNEKKKYALIDFLILMNRG